MGNAQQNWGSTQELGRNAGSRAPAHSCWIRSPGGDPAVCVLTSPRGTVMHPTRAVPGQAPTPAPSSHRQPADARPQPSGSSSHPPSRLTPDSPLSPLLPTLSSSLHPLSLLLSSTSDFPPLKRNPLFRGLTVFPHLTFISPPPRVTRRGLWGHSSDRLTELSTPGKRVQPAAQEAVRAAHKRRTFLTTRRDLCTDLFSFLFPFLQLIS